MRTNDLIKFTHMAPHASMQNIIERSMIGKFKEVEVSTNKRVIKLEELVSNSKNKDKFYIYEKAVVDGFSKGGWDELEHLVYDKGEILLNKANVISCEPIEGKILVNLLSDDGKYIGQFHGKNSMLLAMEIKDLDQSFFSWILEDKFGLSMMDEVEFFGRRLSMLGSSTISNSVNDKKKRLKNAESQMNSLFNSFVNERNKFQLLSAELQGMEQYDDDYSAGVIAQIRTLMNHPKLDSLQLEGNTIIMTTVPLQMGIWDIGKYVIRYTLGQSDPTFDRLTMPTTLDRFPIVNEAGMEVRDHPHPHVNTDRACSGNWQNMFRAFWNNDMLVGFNNAITYLVSSYDDGAPSIRFANWLAGLGYVHDAEIIKTHKITKVDGGVVMRQTISRYLPVKNETLIEWGCTGKISDDPKDYVNFFKSHQSGQGSKTGIKGLEYHAWEDTR